MTSKYPLFCLWEIFAMSQSMTPVQILHLRYSITKNSNNKFFMNYCRIKCEPHASWNHKFTDQIKTLILISSHPLMLSELIGYNKCKASFRRTVWFQHSPVSTCLGCVLDMLQTRCHLTETLLTLLKSFT